MKVGAMLLECLRQIARIQKYTICALQTLQHKYMGPEKENCLKLGKLKDNETEHKNQLLMNF